MNSTKLPSHYQIDEKATIYLLGCAIDCIIKAVRFTEDKVRYDVFVYVEEGSHPGEESYLSSFENVDSALFEKPE